MKKAPSNAALVRGCFCVQVILLVNWSTNMHINTPLRSGRVIAPIFVDRNDFSGLNFDKGSDMARDISLARINVYRCDNQVVQRFNALNFSIPASRILAVGSNKFITSKMFVCVMPVDAGVFVEKKPSFHQRFATVPLSNTQQYPWRFSSFQLKN